MNLPCATVLLSSETEPQKGASMSSQTSVLGASISTEDASYRKHVRVLDTDMAYVDVGDPRLL
jgi:hypothetical protein